MENTLKQAAAGWELEFETVRQDVDICGSPERCEFRFVIETTDGGLYLIESPLEEEIRRKRQIADTIKHLSDQGLSGINPYLPHCSGKIIAESEGRYWQISRFIHGLPLKRPEYVFDRWRGRVAADFLINLHYAAHTLTGCGDGASFSIIKYIIRLLEQIRMYEPKLATKIEPVIKFLEKKFITVHDRLPTAFSHGDFHALNMIWSETGIHAVIDWEFSGIKPEIYDAANMIGCIGIENPQALVGPLVMDFITRLKHAGIISGISWSVLVEFCIALRFAWLSEWLRYNDREMIELEVVFMNLLIDNAENLKQVWNI